MPSPFRSLFGAAAYPFKAVSRQFKANPLRTTGYLAMNAGGAGLLYNQLANAVSPERRAEAQKIKSEEMNKTLTGIFLPPERRARLQKLLDEVPRRSASAIQTGLQEGASDAVRDLASDVKERPGEYAKTFGTAAVASSLPILTYLVWRHYAKQKDRGLEKRAGLWSKLFSRGAKVPESIPGEKLFGNLTYLTGAGSLGAGLYAAGRQFNEGTQAAAELQNSLSLDPDAPGKTLRTVLDKSTQAVSEAFSPQQLATAGVETIERAAKSPWTYLLAGGAVAAPWLLSRLLYKNKKRDREDGHRKTAADSAVQTAADWTLLGSSAALLPALLTRAGRRAAGRFYPVAGTALGLAALRGGGLLPKLTAAAGGRALEATERGTQPVISALLKDDNAPGLFGATSDIALDMADSSTAYMPPQLRTAARDSVAEAGTHLKAPADRPYLTGALAGGATALTAVLGYLLYKRFRDKMQRAGKPSIRRLLGPI